MPHSLQNGDAALPQEPAWVRYSFALTCCAVSIILELFLDRLTHQPVYPFVPAFAAIIASAACAGAGPGLTSTALLVGWAAFDLWSYGRTPINIIWRCALFLTEGAVLSVGSARLWSSRRAAVRSEAWHRRLMQTAGEGIWVCDDHGIIDYANPQMAAILGVTTEELIGHKTDAFFFPGDLSVERIRTANLRPGEKAQFDRRLRRKDGSEVWVLTCCNLLNNEESGERGALAMMTDITERKRAEFALRRSEERFRNLFETVPVGVYQSTPEGRLLAANPMLLEMIGVSNEAELKDLDIAVDFFLDPHVRQRLLERLEHEGRIQNAEYQIRRRDGRVITILENARVVRDGNGGVLYYEGTMADITPRKRMEEQLRQAQKSEALARMAGNIAQDFHNVLTVMSGYSQLVLGELEQGHRARANAERVMESARRAIGLTRQLLSFSRQSTAMQGSIDLNRAIEHAQPALESVMGGTAGQKADLVLSLWPEPVPVLAEESRMEIALLNLAACVRNPAAETKAELKTERAYLDEGICRRCGDAQPGVYAVLSIGASNNGAKSGKAVELFADPLFSPIGAEKAADLGLSPAQELAAERDGFLAANHGAIEAGSLRALHLFLPCALAPVRAARDNGSGSGGETILLVEDEPLFRELSRDMLERQGYEVVLAADAEEAEHISAGAGSFDLLITDAVMPNITGAELARRIRAFHPELKVLFISGYADDAAGPDNTSSEGAALLRKPFSADSLGRKIRQILSRN